MNEILKSIQENIDTRKKLIELKTMINDEDLQNIAYLFFSENKDLVESLMKHDDSKVRKNIVSILAKLNLSIYKQEILDLYYNEEQLFVRSSYLNALASFDCSEYLDNFKSQLKVLLNTKVDETNKKHIREEIHILQNLILQLDEPVTHTFTGLTSETEMILSCNRNHVEHIMETIDAKTKRALSSGIYVKTDNIGKLLDNRLYSEILFPLSKARHVPFHPINIAKSIINSKVIPFLQESHSTTDSFCFRIEIRSELDGSDKSKFVRRVVDEIERLSERQLINSTSNYEIEFRFIQDKDGSLNGYLKLYTINDQRFAYRINSLATSIAPANAALICELASDYFVDNAQVLDPFCGVGTMLIERDIALHTSYLYGLDIYGKAIDMARENADQANVEINFINRDFFTFRHLYSFDEVITNMPSFTQASDKEALTSIYSQFFKKVPSFLKDGSMLFIYSTEEGLMEKNLRIHRKFLTIKKEPILKKDNSHLYILQYNENK